MLPRDYTVVQNGRDISDRVCGVAKARVRSWAATGNDLLNAIDMEETIGYASSITNTKVAVIETVLGHAGHLVVKEKF